MVRNLIFLDNKRYVFVDERNLKIHSSETGKLLFCLQGGGGEIVSLAIAPKNPFHLISIDVDGCLKVWDHTEGKCVFTDETNEIGLGRVVKGFGLVKSEIDSNGNKRRVSQTRWKLVEIDIDYVNKKVVLVKKKVVLVGQQRKKDNYEDDEYVYASFRSGSPIIVRGGVNENYIVFSAGKMVFQIYDIARYKKHTVQQKHRVTCVAAHPNKIAFAAGSENGEINVYHPSNGHFTKPIVTHWHWHADSVLSLDYSCDGTHLISGGLEKVLVVWQIDTGAKTFVSRLGGAILSCVCSPDDSSYGLVLSTNTVCLLDSRTKRIQSEVQCFSSTPTTAVLDVAKNNIKDTRALGLVVDPRTGSLVVQKTHGCLHFFDCKTNKEVGTVDVTIRNTISEPSDMTPIEPVSVDLVAFEPIRSKTMVTVERRNDKACLKFWALDERQEGGGFGGYKVTTLVDQPHSKPVIAVLVNPGGTMAVTCSLDSTFKVWERTGSRTGEWKCRSVAFFRKTPISSAALSPDGSLLAVAYGNIITLWNPLKNVLLKVLMVPNPANKIENMVFYQENLLATATSRGILNVWDLFDGSCMWSLKVGKINALGSNKKELLVFLSRKKLVVFENGYIPTKVYNAEKYNTQKENIMGVAYVERSNQYVYTTSSGTIGYFTQNENDESTTDVESEQKNENSNKLSSFSLVYGHSSQETNNKSKKKRRRSSITQHDDSADGSNESIRNALDLYPSYVLPPMEKLVDNLLFSTKKSTPQTKKQKKQRQENQEPSSQKTYKNRLKGFDKQSDTTTIPECSGDDDELYKNSGRMHDKSIEVDMTAFFKKSY